MPDKPNDIKIKFLFSPYNIDTDSHILKKEDETGHKRRYLIGISSGTRIDGQGEHMTKNCLEYIQRQANEGEILLYDSPHGIRPTDDIGRLIHSEITPNNEWMNTYRLHDEWDGFERGSATLEKADKLWKQLNGLKPYKKKAQKGFSLEGIIPEQDGILHMDALGRRVIDKVDLEGVIVTGKPAYTSSIIESVYKALDEIVPEKKIVISETMRGKLIDKITTDEIKENYYRKRWQLDDTLNEMIEEIMKNRDRQKDRLNILLEEYSKLLIEIVMQNANYFQEDSEQDDLAMSKEDTRRLGVWKKIADNIQDIIWLKKQSQEESNGFKTNKTNKTNKKN